MMKKKYHLFLTLHLFSLIGLFTFEVYSSDKDKLSTPHQDIPTEMAQEHPSKKSNDDGTEEIESKNSSNSMTSFSSIPEDLFFEMLPYFTAKELSHFSVTNKKNLEIVNKYLDFIPYMIDENKEIREELFTTKKDELTAHISQYVLSKYEKDPPNMIEYINTLKESFEPNTGANLEKSKRTFLDSLAISTSFGIAMVATGTSPSSLLSSNDIFDMSLLVTLSSPFVVMATSACACVTYYVKKQRAKKIQTQLKEVLVSKPTSFSQENLSLSLRDQLEFLNDDANSASLDSDERRKKINDLRREFNENFLSESCKKGIHNLIKNLEKNQKLLSIANEIDEESKATYNALSKSMAQWDHKKYGSEEAISFDYIKTFKENICRPLAHHYLRIKDERLNRCSNELFSNQ